MTTIAIAADVGFLLDELEDLKLAVHELFSAACVSVQGHVDCIVLDFWADEEGIVVEANADDGVRAAMEIDELTRALLSLALDECRLDMGGTGLFRVGKRHRDAGSAGFRGD